MKPVQVTFVGGPLDGVTWTVSTRIVMVPGEGEVWAHRYLVDADGSSRYDGPLGMLDLARESCT